MFNYQETVEFVNESLKDEIAYTVDYWKKHLPKIGQKLKGEAEYTVDYWKKHLGPAFKNLKQRTSSIFHDKEKDQLREKVKELQTTKGALKTLGKNASDFVSDHPVATGLGALATGAGALAVRKLWKRRQQKKQILQR